MGDKLFCVFIKWLLLCVLFYRLMNLTDFLVYWCTVIRFATVRRRSAHRLSKLQARDHVVQGMIRALGRIDEIIRLMKASKDTASAKEALTSPDFGFSTEQVRT